nr:PD-(D/E)XK nuclease family protein [Acidobacteriota bacterium]
DRDRAIARARTPSLEVRTATSVALDRTFDGRLTASEIEVIDFSRVAGRPFGPRFGTLVHATLAIVPLDASEQVIAAVARAQGQILLTGGRDGYADEELYAAVEVVSTLLRDPLFDRVRQADRDGRCDRELPIAWTAPDGTMVEGTIDLAFEDAAGLTVVDFKTDRELSADLDRYRRQLSVYCQALSAFRQTTARGILARV